MNSLKKACFDLSNIWFTVIGGMHLAEKHVKGNPQTVADSMTHALLAKHPKMRYLVGTDAKVFFRLLTWLPEWIVDHILGWPAPYGKQCPEFEELDNLIQSWVRALLKCCNVCENSSWSNKTAYIIFKIKCYALTKPSILYIYFLPWNKKNKMFSLYKLWMIDC